MVRTRLEISRFHSFAVMTVAIGAIAILMTLPVPAQTFTTLHSFTGGADGSEPFAGLSMDSRGNLYGTAAYGGHGNCSFGSECGTVYKLQHNGSNWVFYTLYEFGGGADGGTPQARVIVGPDGNLYGTTTNGGAAGKGTVFRLQPPPNFCHAFSCPWTETVLHSFTGGTDGLNPTYGDITFDRAGNIYGTTPFGGSHDCGVVYKLSPAGGTWTESILYTSTCEDGGELYAGVIFDGAGNLYGTTSGAETSNGNVYKLTPTGSGWVESTIYHFQFPGGAYGGLTIDSAGNLYGITFFFPQIYELSPTSNGWRYQTLYSLGGYGAFAQPTLDAAGNLYGTGALSTPEVFRLSPFNQIWTLTGFNGSAGDEPFSNVVVDAGGNLYTTASEGGDHGGGVVFQITP